MARAENFAASLSATGTVVSRNDARISSEVGGTLAWIAEPGTVVRRGDSIARLDPERLSLALRDNEAALKRLDAQLALLATQRARLDTSPGRASSRRASSKRPCRASAWPSRTSSRRAWRAIGRGSTSTAPRCARRSPASWPSALQQAGEFVASGAPLLRLVNDRELEVVARAPMASADSVAAGAGRGWSTATARPTARCAP